MDFAIQWPFLLRRLDALDTLRPGALTTQTREQLKQWCSELLDWLTTSTLGIQEQNTLNNHAVYYDLLVVELALFIGRTDQAVRVLEEFPARRLEPQVAPDGRLPHELDRTRSLDYTTITLLGYGMLADAGSRAGVDLWNLYPPHEHPIRRAMTYTYQAITATAGWTHPQIEPIAYDRIIPPLLLANHAWEGEPFPLGPLVRIPDEIRTHPLQLFIQPKLHPWHETKWPVPRQA